MQITRDEIEVDKVDPDLVDQKAIEFTQALEEDACQSGPSDLAWERRQRDRSGNKPKFRKHEVRKKQKASRKARKVSR
jgi:hypothetical protein